MSRFDDRGRPSRYDRDHSPDYAYAGGSGVPPRVPSSPGHTTFTPPAGPPPGMASHARLEYEPQTPFYPPPPAGPGPSYLQVPDSRTRPRSLPPGDSYYYNNRDDKDNSGGRRSRNRDRDRSPIGKAKRVLENTFTDSTTGLGVGVLGALVGGLAAHEASEATHSSSSSRHHHQSEAQRRNQLLSTVVGAAVGALGANAVERRLEIGREKTSAKQERWEQKWGRRDGGADDADGGDGYRRRSGGGGGRPRSSGNGGGREREVDPDARSWNNVEDWVYDNRDDDRNRDNRRGRRSDDYRY